MSVRRLAPADIQPAAFAFTPENEAWLDAQIAKFPDGRQASAVIPALWQAQKQHDGWLPQRAIEAVALRLGMPLIRVMEVATFYTMFNLEPVGRYFIQLCGTVPCHVKGALDLKQVLLARVGDQRHVTPDGNFAWLEVECLGACCNAPMLQINDDYYEDLTPDLLVGLLDDLAAGRPVTPGSQIGRVSSEPVDGPTTLSDPALFDGSVVGAWKARFREELAAQESPAGSSGASAESIASAAAPIEISPGDLKPAKPDAGRATHRPIANAPAQRVADGEAPVSAGDRREAGNRARSEVASAGGAPSGRSPQSDKSYTATPTKPEEGRTAADARGTTPNAGTPPSDTNARRDGSEVKPVGADPDASPGIAPKR